MTNGDVVIRAESKSEPNLRKLARALIALARLQLDEAEEPQSVEGRPAA